MAQKGQPGGFVQPNDSLPSAPPSYQDTFGGQYGNPVPNQIPTGSSQYSNQYGNPAGQQMPIGNRAPYPTASGAPPYYQQGPQGMTPYPTYQQPAQPPQKSGPAYPWGQPMNMASGFQQQPNGSSPYPKGPSSTPYPQAAAPVAGGQFDAGARFTPYAPPSVPPPPPGCAPNAAQMASAQGQNVNMSQKSGGFFKGSGSGGYTFW